MPLLMTDQHMTDDDLNAIRARVEAATPGEWRVEWDGEYDQELFPCEISARESRSSTAFEKVCDVEELSEADADLIANAPTDLRALLAEVKRLRAEVQQERDYSAALIADQDALCRAAQNVVDTAERPFRHVDDILDSVDDLKMALDRCEAGSEEEKAAEVAALRKALDQAIGLLEIAEAIPPAQSAIDGLSAVLKASDPQ